MDGTWNMNCVGRIVEWMEHGIWIENEIWDVNIIDEDENT